MKEIINSIAFAVWIVTFVLWAFTSGKAIKNNAHISQAYSYVLLASALVILITKYLI